MNPEQADQTPAPPDARDIVIRRVARQARRFPDLSLTPLRTDGLDARDAALAHAIHDAVIRRWLTLSAVLGAVGGKALDTLEPKMQGVLLVGAAQLLLLDRVPDHAAIDEAVSWAKRSIRPGAGGMVNAILRKVAGARAQRRDSYSHKRDEIPLSGGGAVGLSEPLFSENELDRLSAAVGVPRGLLDRWSGAFGFARARELAMHTIVRPPVVLHVGSSARDRVRSPRLRSGLDEQSDIVPGPIAREGFCRSQHDQVTGITCAHDSPDHRVLAGTHDQLMGLLASDSSVWVQDAASSEAVAALADMTQEIGEGLVIDVCAGQGTKTRQLAAVFPEAHIVAAEVDKPRLDTLRAVFTANPHAEVCHANALAERFAGQAALVLLDVPCSNTGVLPRRPEAKYRVDDAQQQRLTGIQRQIIADSVRLLAPGGRLVYSTCSVEREENEDQAVWAAKQHGLRVESERRVFPRGMPGDGPASYNDGAYSAVLQA